MGGKPQPDIDGFTPDQRFFLSFGQIWCANERPEALRLQVQTNPHSPSEFRVNGVVQNMPEFQKAFSCKAGSADGERGRLPRLVNGDGGNPPGGFEQHYLT